MACMTHYCLDCREEWFDNRNAGLCPKCGSGRVHTTFDETPEGPGDYEPGRGHGAESDEDEEGDGN